MSVFLRDFFSQWEEHYQWKTQLCYFISAFLKQISFDFFLCNYKNYFCFLNAANLYAKCQEGWGFKHYDFLASEVMGQSDASAEDGKASGLISKLPLCNGFVASGQHLLEEGYCMNPQFEQWLLTEAVS